MEESSSLILTVWVKASSWVLSTHPSITRSYRSRPTRKGDVIIWRTRISLGLYRTSLCTRPRRNRSSAPGSSTGQPPSSDRRPSRTPDLLPRFVPPHTLRALNRLRRRLSATTDADEDTRASH